MSVTLKTKKTKVTFDYTMSDESLASVSSAKYLGITLNSRLEWGEHIETICGTASRLLGFLRRAMHRCPPALKEKAYKAIIRPRLEYCSSVWDPHNKKYVDKLEMVQRRAARFVTNNPHKRTSLQPSVSSMVDNLGWEPLAVRRKTNRLTTFYKTVHCLNAVPASYLPPTQPNLGTCGHNHQFRQTHSTVDAHKFASCCSKCRVP